MIRILNLTMHDATPSQTEAGVVEPPNKEEVKKLLLFRGMPQVKVVRERAKALAELAAKAKAEAAMIGGAPYLMAPLHAALEAKGVRPLYAFSERRSKERTNDKGEVEKVNMFIHLGFVG